MDWSLEEAIAYYRRQGAPSDQAVLIGLLKEVQQNQGCISKEICEKIADCYGIKSALLFALIRRLPGLKMAEGHILELCSGKTCGKACDLADYAQKNAPAGVTVKQTGCMRLCGKGPNLRWDGQIFHQADKALIQRLFENKK